jgi:hypothetical protein
VIVERVDSRINAVCDLGLLNLDGDASAAGAEQRIERCDFCDLHRFFV